MATRPTIRGDALDFRWTRGAVEIELL